MVATSPYPIKPGAKAAIARASASTAPAVEPGPCWASTLAIGSAADMRTAAAANIRTSTVRVARLERPTDAPSSAAEADADIRGNALVATGTASTAHGSRKTVHARLYRVTEPPGPASL